MKVLIVSHQDGKYGAALASIFFHPLRGPYTACPSYGLSLPTDRIQPITQYMNGLGCASQLKTA